MQLTVNGCHPIMVTPTSSRDKQWLQVPFHAGLSAQLNLGAEGSTYLRVDLRKGGTVPLKMGLCPNWTVERALCPIILDSGMERDAEQ